jgi:glycosyltransferase involved in cell wall biosynthesis
MIKVAITSPSLNAKNNVSGIANHTRLVISTAKHVDYTHVTIGKKDTQKRNAYWIYSQLDILAQFVTKIRGVRLVHLNIPLTNLSIVINLLLACICLVMKKFFIVHFRGGELNLDENHSLLQRIAVRFFLNFSSAIIVLGEREKNFFYSKYKKAIKSRIYVLPNAVKIPNIDKTKVEKFFFKDVVQLVYVGRLDFSKGLMEISEALEICSDSFNYHLHIVGGGPDASDFEKKLHSCIENKYTMHGVKYIDEIYSILNDCHIFIMPSYFEGLPNSMLEAMANYVVPIVTEVGSIPEVVSSENGFLVNIKDSNMLAETLCEAVSDRRLLYNKSVKGGELIENHYSIDSYCNKLLDIYKNSLV